MTGVDAGIAPAYRVFIGEVLARVRVGGLAGLGGMDLSWVWAWLGFLLSGICSLTS
jgi:hypothetical protein